MTAFLCTWNQRPLVTAGLYKDCKRRCKQAKRANHAWPVLWHFSSTEHGSAVQWLVPKQNNKHAGTFGLRGLRVWERSSARCWHSEARQSTRLQAGGWGKWVAHIPCFPTDIFPKEKLLFKPHRLWWAQVYFSWSFWRQEWTRQKGKLMKDCRVLTRPPCLPWSYLPWGCTHPTSSTPWGPGCPARKVRARGLRVTRRLCPAAPAGQGEALGHVTPPQALSGFSALSLGHVSHTLLIPVPTFARSARSPARWHSAFPAVADKKAELWIVAGFFLRGHSRFPLLYDCEQHGHVSSELSVSPWVLLHLCLSLGMQKDFPAAPGSLQCSAVTEQANLVGPAATSGPTEYLWVEGDLSASTGSNLQSYSDSSRDLRCPWGTKRVESRTYCLRVGDQAAGKLWW